VNPSRPRQGEPALQGAPARRPTLGGLVLLFLKVGAIGFGGGMAVIALMEDELVRRRRWFDAEELLHGMALGQILGSFATNAAFFVGQRLFGLPGALACAAAFMAPSVTLVIMLSWLYFRFHSVPAMAAATHGLGPVVIALILNAAWTMGRKAVRTWTGGLLMAAALALTLFKVNSLAALALGAIAGWYGGAPRLTGTCRSTTRAGVAPSILPVAVAPLATLPLAPGLLAIGWTFLKVGLVFLGGGFVLVPVLHQRLVATLGWLTPAEFMDGVALSNLTPGPIAVLATFVGYRLQGVSGALVATLALFAPALALMGLLSHGYGRFRNLGPVQDLLSGLAPAMVGLILGTGLMLAPGALHGWQGPALTAAALVLFNRFRWHPAVILGIAALLGAVGLVR
jgi:chromate transporter